MLVGKFSFSKIPAVGFAHHFTADKNYHAEYGICDGLEIVYIENGSISMRLYNQEYIISEGDILVLPRNLPIEIYTNKNISHSHCTIQLLLDYELELIEKSSFIPTPNGLILPLITQSCKETHDMKIDIHKAISDLGISKDYNLGSSLIGLSILQKLSAIYENNITNQHSSHHILVYKIKKYISDNINRSFTIEEMSQFLHKAPNYLNCIFKQGTGISIRQYINNEKARIISEMMQTKGISFKLACENVGIYDISYGYRLFKKHIGVTPSQYLNTQIKHN